MFSIGEFAGLAGVSPRTLRHYDELGLLVPANVDPITRYRFYSARQLPRLNRILVLKDLGFSLEELVPLLAEDLSVAELRGMLRMRERELSIAIGQERSRLDRVGRLLRAMEEETMSDLEIIPKRVAAMRVASLSAGLPKRGWETTGPIFRGLHQRLVVGLREAGVQWAGPRVNFIDGNERLVGHAAVPVDPSVTAIDGFDVLGLPEIEAATLVVPLSGTDAEWNNSFQPAFRALARWVEDNGYENEGSLRAIILEADGATDGPRPDNITFEFQMPYRPA